MTDAIAFAPENDHVEAASVADQINRPARPSEIKMVHGHLMNAVAELDHYSDEFKSFESNRLTTTYLRGLMAIDPRHVLLLLSDGEIVGFQITGPEMGTLWLYWSYIFPEARKHTNPIKYTPALVKLWDNDRYHKIATYIRPTNKVAIVLCRRGKFEHIVTLKNHIFGQDYMLFESQLNKAVEGYDRGMGLGFLKRLAYRLLVNFGL